MAKISIRNIKFIGMRHRHDATDWQVALDRDFSRLIDESIDDEKNLLEWHTPLKKIDSIGFYSDENMIYARARVRFKNYKSDWIVLTDNQNYQEVIITENDKENIYTNSDEIGML